MNRRYWITFRVDGIILECHCLSFKVYVKCERKSKQNNNFWLANRKSKTMETISIDSVHRFTIKWSTSVMLLMLCLLLITKLLSSVTIVIKKKQFFFFCEFLFFLCVIFVHWMTIQYSECVISWKNDMPYMRNNWFGR